MPANLSIHPSKPFKSSRLALPPSPFSPQFPLSPPPAPSNPRHNTSHTRRPSALPAPPPEPLHWLWQCHLCNRVYKLDTTRRCLEDGHLFCSGTTTVKRSRKSGKKVIRHKACASEFDYAGWKAWGVWRRDVAKLLEEDYSSDEEGDVPRPLFASKVPSEDTWFKGYWTKKAKSKKDEAHADFWKKDCWNHCDYPSECRWGKQYGVATPTLPLPPVPQKDEKPKTNFEDILLTIPEAGSADDDGDVSVLSPPLSPDAPESLEEPTKKPSFDDLLESVKRRKRRSCGAIVEVPSPLASHPPSPTTVSMADAMDLAGSTEHVEDLLKPSSHMHGEGEGQTALQRAFDDFDLEFRRGFEKAGAALTGFVSAVRSTAALEEEKAESFVSGLKGKKRWT